jgi:hypothetical protein
MPHGYATMWVMTEAIWCVAYGLLWWWVAVMLPATCKCK